MKRTILGVFLLFFLASFLRTYKFTAIPPGLYVDEASVAYNAYAILKTGKDEHGIAFPFAFQAFGEYKMPVFIYMTSISMALFGKNEFAIRIPSAFFGSLTVVVFYFFAKELIVYEKKLSQKQKEIFAFLSAFLLAITPWHLQFSRAGFEAIVALFFFLVGMLFFLYFYRLQNKSLPFISFLALVLSVYSYNAFRVIGLVSLACLFMFLFISLKKQRQVTTAAGIVALLCAFPMIVFSFTPAGQARFSQVSAFTTAKFFLFPLEYINNYIAHFSLSFLFSYGDSIGRHIPFRMAPLFKWELVFLLAGCVWLIKEKKNLFWWVILFLLFISPTAAAVALPSPHVLRSLPLVLPITLLVSYAAVRILQKKQYVLLGIVGIIACLEVVLYIDYYYNHATVTLADWGGQYKELITKLATEKKNDTIIIINDNVGMNPIYVKFYEPDMKIQMVGDTWKKPASLDEKNILYVTSAEKKQRNIYLQKYPHTFLDTVTTPDSYHTVLYNIWHI